jgi:hypothetical protein
MFSLAACRARIAELESALTAERTRREALEAALEFVRAEYVRGFWNDDTLLRIDAALASGNTEGKR